MSLASSFRDQALALRHHLQVELLYIRGRSLRSRPPRALKPAVDLTYFIFPKGVCGDFSLALRLLMRMLCHGRPDVLHAHWSTGLRGVVLASRLARRPVVFTEHGGPFPGRSGRVPDARRTLNEAALVLPVSNWLRCQLADQGVTAPMQVVPNICGLSFLADTRERRRSSTRRGRCATRWFR